MENPAVPDVSRANRRDVCRSSGRVRLRACAFPVYPASGGWSAIASPVAFPACISTCVPEIRLLPTVLHADPPPIRLRHRPIVQWRVTGGGGGVYLTHTTHRTMFDLYRWRLNDVGSVFLHNGHFGCATTRYVDRSSTGGHGILSRHKLRTASGAGRRSPPPQPFAHPPAIRLRSRR